MHSTWIGQFQNNCFNSCILNEITLTDVETFLYLIFLFQAEARLAARRQARYEARNIRMKELEKKQKEEEENQVNHNSIYPGKKNKSSILLLSVSY